MSHPTISRRDFLNGMLIAAGGLAVGQSSPIRLLAGQRSQNSCDGAIGLDPRALRGGNLPSAFDVAHWMRDRRLTFSRTVVTLAKGCDAESGSFAIREDGGSYDVVIVGSGVSGLSTAFFLPSATSAHARSGSRCQQRVRRQRSARRSTAAACDGVDRRFVLRRAVR